MTNRIFIFVLLLTLIVNCKTNTNDHGYKHEANVNKSEKIDTLRYLIDNIDSIKVVSLEKGYMETSLPDSLICETWILTEDDFRDIIKNTRKIDYDDLHYLYDTQTCIYKGIIEVNNEHYDFFINSGGWVYLDFGSITLGCFDEKCEKYFLGKVDKPEEAE